MLQAGAHAVADRSARGDQARAIAAGSRQGRRRHQDAAGSGHQISERAGREALARVDARARAEIQRRRGDLPADDRRRSEERRRAEFTRLHARRARTEARRSGSAGASGRSRSSRATARISTASAGPTTSRTASSRPRRRCEKRRSSCRLCRSFRIILAICSASAACFRKRSTPGRRRSTAMAIHLSLGARRQDQIGAPEAWPKKVSSPFRFSFSRLGLAACGPRRRALPSGPGTPAPDFAPTYAARARRVRERADAAGRAGSVGSRRRAARCAGACSPGLVPGALRLEGVAPFGAPVFILVADGTRGTLLLSRDRRVVRDAAPEEILNALVGIRLGPGRSSRAAERLRAGRPRSRRRLARTASDWLAVDLASGGTVYLQRVGDCVADRCRALRRSRDRLRRVRRRPAVADCAARHRSEPRRSR